MNWSTPAQSQVCWSQSSRGPLSCCEWSRSWVVTLPRAIHHPCTAHSLSPTYLAAAAHSSGGWDSAPGSCPVKVGGGRSLSSTTGLAALRSHWTPRTHAVAAVRLTFFMLPSGYCLKDTLTVGFVLIVNVVIILEDLETIKEKILCR